MKPLFLLALCALLGCGTDVTKCGDFTATVSDPQAQEVVDAAEAADVPVVDETSPEDPVEDSGTKDVTVVGCGGIISSNENAQANGDGSTVTHSKALLAVIRSGNAELVRVR